jgi:chemotaxis protein methyltransferase CheR/type IV pilus assembly protein PilK
MRETGYHDYSQYYEYMASEAQHEEEWSLLVDRLTVHETCFFRHESSMKLVREIVLPEVCVQGGRCSVWSVGCATGEEAYSLAMLIDSYCATLSESCSYRVFGTDISAPSLHHARAGMYLQRRLRNVKESFRTKYCRPVSSVRFSIDSRLRENVEFFLLNLRDLEQAPLRHMNLIFCQNLLIYYERERRLQLINCLAEFLCPGGMLVLGPGEVLNWQHPSMEKVRFDDTLAYRRAV